MIDGWTRIFDSYRCLSCSLGELVKTLDNDDFEILKDQFPDKWENLNKNLANPYEEFNSIDGYQKSVDILEKEDFFSKLKIKYPDDKKIERTKEIIKLIIFKRGEELTRLYLMGYFIISSRFFRQLHNSICY